MQVVRREVEFYLCKEEGIMKSVKTSVVLFVSLLTANIVFAQSIPALNDDFGQLDRQIWNVAGRGEVELRDGAVAIKDCFIYAGEKTWQDYEMSFRARAPKDAEQVQIWAGFRCKDRDNRYVIGLRGGNNDDLYLARYSPGGDEFLALEELGFHPEPGLCVIVKRS